MLSTASAIDTGSEWAAACAVQESFMPRADRSARGLSYGAHCRQVGELGGDCYDFAPLPDGRMAFAIGDASGKGIAAALMIANVQSSLRTAALFTGNDVAAVVKAVNGQVHASSPGDRYATLFYGVFDESARTLRYVNAGHNPPMVIRRDGSTTWLETGGAPVGMFPDWSYEEGSVRLGPDDLLVAYTDGVIETSNPAGREWGVEGLRSAAAANRAESPDELVRAVFKSMDEFSLGRQTDDATMVVLRRR